MRLGDVALIHTTPILPTTKPNAKFFYVALENIESGTGKLVGSTEAKGESIKSNKFTFGAEHVLFGKLRPYLNKVLVPDRKGICSTDILPLKPRPDLLTRDFLAWCLRNPNFVEYSSAKMDGGKMPRLRTPDLENYEISVPPLGEQRRLVARIEAVASRIHELVNHTRVITEAVDRTLAAFYERIIDGALSSPFGEIAKLVRRAIKTTPDSQYAEMGIRSFGKGTFQKPVILPCTTPKQANLSSPRSRPCFYERICLGRCGRRSATG